MINLLIDADMLLFRATSSCEHEIDWGNNLWTLHSDITECQQKFMSIYKDTIEALQKHKKLGTYGVTMVVSDKNNFRKLVLPTYKSNRVSTRKPVSYRGMLEWLPKEFHVESRPYLEADDLCSILSKPGDILVSADKDFQTIPNRYFYSYMKDELKGNTQGSADYFWYYQCLAGDTCDGYSGAKGIGSVGAKKLLDTNGATWESVVAAYESKGLTEEDALQQSRVARILREGDYRDGKIFLWSPRDSFEKTIDTNEVISNG